MLEHSYISSAGSLALFVVAISFVPTKLSRKRRVAIGALHAFAHMTAALILMLLLEFGIEICIRNHLLATSGTRILGLRVEHIATRALVYFHCTCLISVLNLQNNSTDHQRLSQTKEALNVI